MHPKRAFPGANEAAELDVEDLAMCVLDLLVCGSVELRGALTSRARLVNHFAGIEYTAARRKLEPRSQFSFTSDQAIAAFPGYARALTEAWTYLEGAGLIVPDPQHPGNVFVGVLGKERHGMYRGRAAPEPPHRPQVEQEPVVTAEAQEPSPSAVVIWAHDDPEWSPSEKQTWQDTIVSFTHLLRGSKVDADLDLFHGHLATDWARFGPAAIRDSEFAIVAVSRTWRRAWDGDVDDGAYAGARGEANVLLGLFQESNKAFLEKVIPVVLPGATEDDIPQELKATTHWSRVPTLDEAGIDELYRRLTKQAGHPKPPLGTFRKLGPVSEQPQRDINVDVAQAEDALAGLPTPSTDSDAPKDQARRSLETRRDALLRELASLGEEPSPDPPRLEPHHGWGTGTFNLHMPSGPLNVHLLNSGGSTAHILSARLITALGTFEGLMYAEEPPPLQPDPGPVADLPPDTHLFLAFGDGQLASLPGVTEPLRLRVRYMVRGRPETFEYRLNLHRASSDAGFRPQWRSKSPETLRVE
jgi:hypothetical protein